MLTGVQDAEVAVTVGVDTHADIHVAAALDQFGRLLGTTTAPTTEAGHDHLVTWAASFGTLHRFGLEGTGSYGVGLARHLRAQGLEVVEVIRRTDRPGAARARPTRLTRRSLPGPCWREPCSASRKPPMARWR
ncbi:hypothetical protein GCM10009533_19880 [Saccharopolyspora spinosporotrichia]|uniref:Transposase IS110-like N-terminal domain-containing protein n=1 Tax=Saccharopolyspora erythraea TaxID=1836 RepID=A0ABN1CK58_SACER